MDRRGAASQADRPFRTLPGVLLAAYVALMPIQLEAGSFGLPLRLAPSDVALAAYLVVALPRIRYVPRAWSAWLLVLPALMGTGMLVAYVRSGYLTQYAYLQKAAGLVILLAGFACLVDFARSWDRLRGLLRVFMVSVLLNATAGVFGYVLAAAAGTVIPVLNEPFPGVRLTGFLIDPNAFGGLVAVALLMHLVTTTAARPLLTGPVARVADVVLPVALLLTFSRSAWIGFTAGVLALAALRPRAAARPLRRMVAGALLAVPLLGTFLALLLANPLGLIQRPDQVQSRLSIGEDALAELARSPLLGTGVGTYQERHGVIVHNTTLWFLTELGLVGLLVFLALVWSVASRLLGAHRLAPPDERPLALALLAAHAAMLGLSVGIEAFYQRHWWLVIGLGAAAWSLSARRPAGATERAAVRT
ncbi:O-antigen ligase family protein [Pseudonocardia sp. C8]|uniref:O-antigen ligase family protein n=1 Tax=Pseudonocardia sp. C8 TaxID=2762759 RepID=UPI0016432239|nr:O-antigen ligase family protein [Pseudonocardia sp. C8]